MRSMSHDSSVGSLVAITLVAGFFTAVAASSAAASNMVCPPHETAGPRRTGGSTHRFGLELTPVSALARIWVLHGTYSAWKGGDVVAGYVYQNQMIGDAGRAHGHTLALGYRQFLRLGFNLQIEHWIAYNPIESSVDGRTYKGWDGWLEVMPGYRWDFYRSNAVDLYILAQVEFGWVTFRTNAPPKLPHNGVSPFVIPLVWFGARF
jgi:hypothetical protein